MVPKKKNPPHCSTVLACAAGAPMAKSPPTRPTAAQSPAARFLIFKLFTSVIWLGPSEPTACPSNDKGRHDLPVRGEPRPGTSFPPLSTERLGIRPKQSARSPRILVEA